MASVEPGWLRIKFSEKITNKEIPAQQMGMLPLRNSTQAEVRYEAVKFIGMNVKSNQVRDVESPNKGDNHLYSVI